MRSELLVRLAAPEDLSAAARVTVESYRERGFVGEAEEGYADKLADTASRARDAELYVAVLDGAVVGCVTFCPYGSRWNEIAQPGEGEFRMLGVLPSAAGRGVGRALTERCIERSRELGYTAVVLSTLPSMSTAHRMYAALGFERTPDLDWEPAPGTHLWTFRLDL